MNTPKKLAVAFAVVAIALLAVVPIASAAEIEGKVTKVDMATRVITLDDGTALKFMNAAQLRDVKPGANVKASYEQRNGEKIATSIHVDKPGGAGKSSDTGTPSATPPRSQ